jgi:small conductance mechanosensitive channel
MEKWMKDLGIGPEMMDTLISYGTRILGVILIIFLGLIVAKWIKSTVKKRLTKTSLDETLTSFISGLVYWLVVIVAIVSCLGIFGVETTSFAAVLGGASVAIGLAFQGSLSNVAAGAMLLIFRPFKVGDVVEVGGETGKVTELDLFFTNIDTPDNRRIIVPNGQIFGKTIENKTFHETRRCDVAIGVGYGDDMDQAREVLLEAAKTVDGVMEDPEPQVYMTELGGSSVDFSVRVWCTTADYWTVKENVMQTVKEACDEAGLDIPYPHRVVIQESA